MGRIRYRTKIDLGVAAVTIALGLFFAYNVYKIETLSENAIGPAYFPAILSTLMIGLGVLVGASALFFNSTVQKVTGEAEDGDEKFGFRDSDITRVVLVVAMGFVYIALFYAFGYFIATFISLALMLLVFGNRNIGLILALSVIGALAYQYVFMGLMGLYDPAGLYFDQGRFLENPSWHELTRKLPF
ncbi:MAG: tripartite tricarboxylate transporter TctB family protein [Hyphomicrobiaceae bacterium]